MNDTIFGKIIRKEIPAEIVYEDDVSIAFKDISPQAPIHILIIPKLLIDMPENIEESHQEIVGHLFVVAKILAKNYSIYSCFSFLYSNSYFYHLIK